MMLLSGDRAFSVLRRRFQHLARKDQQAAGRVFLRAGPDGLTIGDVATAICGAGIADLAGNAIS